MPSPDQTVPSNRNASPPCDPADICPDSPLPAADPGLRRGIWVMLPLALVLWAILALVGILVWKLIA